MSTQHNQTQWGRIFMGPSVLHETTLDRIESSIPATVWTKDTEEKYLERVRQKAAAQAVEIIKDAQMDAEQIKIQANQDGYQDGLKAAEQELEEYRQTMGESVQAVLEALKKQAKHLTAVWQEELITLAKICIEKIVNHELNNNSRELLSALFGKACATLDENKKVVVKVNPDDADIVSEVINLDNSNTTNFIIKPDSNLDSGSLLLETEESMINNSLSVRQNLVQEILDQLILPDLELEKDHILQPLETEQSIENINNSESLNTTHEPQEKTTEPITTITDSSKAEIEPKQIQAVNIGLQDMSPEMKNNIQSIIEKETRLALNKE